MALLDDTVPGWDLSKPGKSKKQQKKMAAMDAKQAKKVNTEAVKLAKQNKKLANLNQKMPDNTVPPGASTSFVAGNGPPANVLGSTSTFPFAKVALYGGLAFLVYKWMGKHK